MFEFLKKNSSEQKETKDKAANTSKNKKLTNDADRQKSTDDYIAKLWHFDLQAPQMGMRSAEELQQIFYTDEFPYKAGSYQAGELCFMANISEKLLMSFVSAAKEIDDKYKAESETGNESIKILPKLTEEDEQKKKQLQELIRVTENRRAVVLKDLRPWVEGLDTVAYYCSAFTHEPYIDAMGRVYLFTESEAMAKAREKAAADADLSFVSLSAEALNERLYLNGCDILVLNEGGLPFSARRLDFLGPSAAEQREADKRIDENSRALRFFLLNFSQIANTTQELDKTQLLIQFEAQMAPRFLQAKPIFKTISKATDAEEHSEASEVSEGEETTFAILSDGQEHHAIACYLNWEAVPEPEEEAFSSKVLPLFPIAQNLLSTAESIDGIIINPGEINFMMDRNWLTRLVRFGEYMIQQRQEKEAKAVTDENKRVELSADKE